MASYDSEHERCGNCDQRQHNCRCPDESHDALDEQLALGTVVAHALCAMACGCTPTAWCVDCSERFSAFGFQVAR